MINKINEKNKSQLWLVLQLSKIKIVRDLLLLWSLYPSPLAHNE